MTGKEFLFRLSSLNSCLDANSGIPVSIPLIRDRLGKDRTHKERLFPPVKWEENKMVLAGNDEEEAILSINDIPIDSLIELVNERLPNTTPTLRKYLFENLFPLVLAEYTGIHAPFYISYQKDNRIQTKKIKGIKNEEFMKQPVSYMVKSIVEEPVQYQVYPASSIALLSLYSLDPEFTDKNLFTQKMEALSELIQKHRIRNLFIDLSKNLWGNFEDFLPVLDYIRHDSIFYGVAKVQHDTLYGMNEYIPYKKECIRLPQQREDRFSGNLFVLQGTLTGSAAAHFCHTISSNQLGKLVGQVSGSLMNDFTAPRTYRLPHTQLRFNCAREYWEVSDEFHTESLFPDIYWETDCKIQYKEKELNQILHFYRENYR